MLAYLAVRLGLLPFIKRLTTERIALAALEQSHFMESVRAILPIRVYSQEVQRHGQWQNKLVATLNKDITLGKINIGSALTNQLLFGAENLVVVYIGASLVMEGTLSIGMLLAFMAYKARFVSALDGVVNKLIELSMLGVHFNRLSDILLTPSQQKPLSLKTKDDTFEKQNVQKVLEITKEFEKKVPIFYSSFDIESCISVKQINPKAQCGILIDNCDIENVLRLINKYNFFSCGFHIKCFSTKLVKTLKKNNIFATVYSHENIAHNEALELWKLGIDSIFSDDPKNLLISN